VKKPVKKAAAAPAKKDTKMKKDSSDSSDSSDSEAPAAKKQAAPAGKDSSSDSDESEKPAAKGKAAAAKKQAKAASSSDDDSDDNSSDAAPAKKAAKKDSSSGSGSGSGSSSDAEEAPAKEGSRKNSEAAAATAPAATTVDESDPNFGKLELFVQGLSFDTTEDGLHALFGKFGTLTKCKHFQQKGKAFVEYETHINAKTALEATNETDLDGRTIWVEFSGQGAGGYQPGAAGGDAGDVTTLFVGNLGFQTARETVE